MIIYDQLEAPTLWIESNKDKSEAARARIVPAEHVQALIEVKAAFNTQTVRQAADKLDELAPLPRWTHSAPRRQGGDNRFRESRA